MALAIGLVAAQAGAPRAGTHGDDTLALLLAERTGPIGHVYANEIDPAMVVEIRRRLLSGDLRNITPVLGAPADPLAATRRRLKPGARMIVIEADLARSQHEGGCYSAPDLTRQRFRDAGFEVASVEETILADYPFFVLTAIVPESRRRSSE